MTTKSGIKLYIEGIEREIDKMLKGEISSLKLLERDLKVLKKRKSPDSSDGLQMKYLSKEIKKTAVKIAQAERHKKELTLKMVNGNLGKLRKHPCIVGVEIEKKGFQVYTRPLKIKRQKIGHYQINFLYKSPGAIYIFNLYKKRRDGELDHWFVKNGKPCFGAWRKDLREYLYSGNIYLIVDTLIRFLTSDYHSGEGYTTFKKFTRNY